MLRGLFQITTFVIDDSSCLTERCDFVRFVHNYDVQSLHFELRLQIPDLMEESVISR